MAESVMYHEGNRKLQDKFDSLSIQSRTCCFKNSSRHTTRSPKMKFEGNCFTVLYHEFNPL